jgi:hypothetical protein
MIPSLIRVARLYVRFLSQKRARFREEIISTAYLASAGAVVKIFDAAAELGDTVARTTCCHQMSTARALREESGL